MFGLPGKTWKQVALATVGGLILLVGIGVCFAAVGGSLDPDEILEDVEARTAEKVAPTATPQPTVAPTPARVRATLVKKHEEVLADARALNAELLGYIDDEDYDRLCANIEEFRSRQVRIHATMAAVENELLGRPNLENVEIRNNKEETFDDLASKCKLLNAVNTPTPQPGPTITPAVPTQTPTGPTPVPEPNPASIGQIGVRTSTGEDHGGTGFVIGVDGVRAYVVTNHHVVDDAAIMVFALGNQLYDDVTLLGSHEHEDVAVLSVCCDLFTVLPSSTEPLTPGTEVVAVGLPLDSGEVIRSRGKVLRLTQRYGSSSPVIEHTAELHPGSSGSPLLNANGAVIGINKGTNVEDATKFVATSYASVKSLIARWTGRVVSEADTAPAEPSMWVILSDPTGYSSHLVVHVDTEFDFADEGGMDVLVDGERYTNLQRIYADEGRYELTGFSEKLRASAERVSIQTDDGFDMRCEKDEALSNEQETVFACTWR